MSVKTVSPEELSAKVNAALGKRPVRDFLYDRATEKLTFAGKAVLGATISAAIGVTWWGVKTFITSTTGTSV